MLNTFSQYCDTYFNGSHWVEMRKNKWQTLFHCFLATSLPNPFISHKEKIDVEYLVAMGLMNWFISMNIHQCSCGIKLWVANIIGKPRENGIVGRNRSTSAHKGTYQIKMRINETVNWEFLEITSPMILY